MSSKVFKKVFERDVVYLYQYPRLKNCPNLSPYALKMETMFRLYKIPHEIISTMTQRPKNGHIPFIELNGEQIAQPDLIEMKIKSHFRIPKLNDEQEAQSAAISRMIENHLLFVLIIYKVAVSEFYSTAAKGLPVPGFTKPAVIFLMKQFLPGRIKSLSKNAIGHFNEKELDVILRRDLKTIENLLINRKFLFGDEMTCTDATVFGQLATMYYPFDNHLRQVIDEGFPRLKIYMEDVIEKVYPNDFSV